MQKLRLCESCKRTGESYATYCLYCHGQLERVVLLYQKMVREHPKLRQQSIAEAFEGLYERYIKMYTDTHGQKRP